MRRLILASILFAGAVGASALVYYGYPQRGGAATAAYATPEERDPYVRFDMEAYDSIRKNYWQNAGEAQLGNLFQLSLEKAAGISTTSVAATDRASTAKMLKAAFDKLSSDSDKQQLALGVIQIALYNLAPQGRDELLSSQAETQLRQTVANVNPSTNLYAEIGAGASSSPAQLAQAFTATKAKLEASPSSTPQALERARYAYAVLSSAQSRARYDSSGAEPTVFSRAFGSTLYVDVDKMSPATLQEFAAALEGASSTPLSSMIIDVRGNIGGSLDLGPYLIGLFVGQNAYTFDLFRKGDYSVQRSPVGKMPGLSRYEEIVVLTDGMTQSTAEVFAAAMKRFRLATVVGSTTRGWGSVENTYPLETKISTSADYALLLVNALTLRDDGQPIEGSGVEPDIKPSDPNWKVQLAQKLRSPALISAVEKTITQPPLR